MDGNDNIFLETGSGGPESGPAKSDSDNSGNHEGIAGRIDLALARDAQGGGAPRNASDGDGNNIGNVAAGTTGPEQHKRGRGRPRKDGQPAGSAETVTDKSKEARNIRASFIERTLYSIHLSAAAITKCPEFKLDKDDAKELGDAVAGVLALHKVRMTPAQEAYAILFETAARIYPPMVVSIYIRKKAEAEGKGKVLPWKGAAPQTVPTPPKPQTPAPQQPTPKPASESILPAGFDPLSIKLDN